MSTSFGTQVTKETRVTKPSTNDHGNSNIKTKKISHSSHDESNKNLGIEDDSSSIHISDSDSSDEKSIKPFAPRP